MNYSSIWWICN